MHIERFEVVKRRAEMALHGNTLYIGGQVADDPSGDIQDQTRQVLENIDRLLQSVGSDRARCSRYAYCSPTGRTTPVSTRSGTSGSPKAGRRPAPVAWPS